MTSSSNTAATSPYNGEAIKVVVGPEKATLSVHEVLVCHYSTFFEGAMRVPLEESKTKTVVLDEDDPATFCTFVNWLYTGRLLAFTAEDPAGRKVVQREAIAAWIFGDKRGAPVFRNAAVDAWREDAVSFKRVGFDHRLIYGNTVPGANLRKMYAEAIAHVSSFEYFKPENKSEVSKDFLLDVLGALKDVDFAQRNKWWSFDFGCRFHDHEDGEHCKTAS